MEALTINDIRKKQIDILDFVTYFCDSNDIPYFLCGGTLLGAIRHKGYIPWDDDIDVMMLRNDYERFIKMFEKSDTPYNLLSFKNTLNYNLPFIKISDNSTILQEDGLRNMDIGVNIDIFPIDYIPEKKQGLFYLKLKFLRWLLRFRAYDGKHEKRLFFKYTFYCGKLLVSFLSVKWILKVLDKFVKKDKYISNLAGITVWGYFEREICRSDIYRQFILVEFEGKQYHAPYLYDEYLTNIYGDYMELPPPGKRFSHHHFKVYLKG